MSRKKTGMDDAVPGLIDAQVAPKEFRKNWARLIQKIYQVDPLLCPEPVPAKAGMSGGHESHWFYRR